MKVDIAIITIREDEFNAVIQRFKPRPFHQPGKRSYGISNVQAKDGCHYTVAIARCSEQGNDTSHKLASDMIRDLNPQIFLVVGIAGGVPHDEFTLGDVIVSTRIHNLNVGKQNEDGTITFNIQGGIHPRIGDITGNLPLYRDRLVGWNSPASIGQECPDLDPQQVIIGGNADWRKKIQESLELHFGTGQNRPSEFKTGPIASSNHLIRNPLTLNRWRDIARTILAVEMESAGVYEATQGVDRQYPIMAIRGISDIVGLERDRRWTAYACQTAAAFAHALVMCGVLALPTRRGISRREVILMGVGIGTGVVVSGIGLAWRKKER
jgi:nucleoside phosphorylase